MKKIGFSKTGFIGLLAVSVVIFLSTSVHAEKMKITGKNKTMRIISQTTGDPGDKDGHMLMQTVTLSQTTSSDENWNDTRMLDIQQADQMGETGTHTGYGYHLHKGGDRTFFKYWGTQKSTGAEMSNEGKYEWTGGTGKFQNIKGGGTYTCKGTMTSSECDWQGEVEY